MHAQYIRNLDSLLVKKEDTFLWLSKGDLKAETESSNTRPSVTNKILRDKNIEQSDR